MFVPWRSCARAPRTWQFSLAALLLAITAVSLPLAWIGYELRSSEREQRQRHRTLKELAKLHGTATAWSPNGGAMHLFFRGSHFGEGEAETLRRVLGKNPNVTQVALFDTTGTNAALAVLQRADGLEEVQICGSDMDEAGIDRLARILTLRRLAIQRTPFTKADIEARAAFADLEWFIVTR